MNFYFDIWVCRFVEETDFGSRPKGTPPFWGSPVVSRYPYVHDLLDLTERTVLSRQRGTYNCLDILGGCLSEPYGSPHGNEQ